MKTDYKSTRAIKGRLLSLLLTAAMVFTLMFTLPPITVYAAEPTYAGTYAEFLNAVEDEVPIIIVTNNFSLEGDVTIDQPVTITSDSGYTINTGNHSLKIVDGGEVLLEGNLSLTGTSTTIQVLYGGDLELPENYYGTISTTGAGGKAIYAVGGVTTRVNIAGGIILADSDAKSALSLGDYTTRVTIRGGTISGSGDAYGIYMEDGYGAPLNIYMSESGPDIDEVYVHWRPADAPELEGDYLLLQGLPDPISLYVNEVKELEIDNYLGEWDANYEEGDRVPELNAEFKFMSSNLYLSPGTTGVYNLILNIVGTKLTIPVTVTHCFNGGDGSEEDPFQIETAEQLNRVRNFLGPAYKDTYFKLTAPIDLSSYTNWEPIGDVANPFCGNFFGAVYDSESETNTYQTVSNLTIDQPDTDYVGLFGYCASACIEGVAIRNADVTGGINSDTGALVGQSVGYIASVYQPTQIRYCSATGSVTAVDGFAVGGLVGMATDTQITQSYSTAGVTGALSSYAGGLVGYLYSSRVENSYATGSVTSTGEDKYAGGLVGWNADSEINRCYAAGKVTGDDETGGLIGHSNNFDISQSYFNIANAGSSDDNSKGQGLMTGSMIHQSDYFEYWDFDSDGIWGVDPWESYPYLQGNEQIPHPTPPLATSAGIVEESVEPRYNASTKTLTMTYADNGANFMAGDVTPGDGLFMWSSSNTDITDISWHDDGIITIYGVGAGTAIISLKSSNGNTLDSITVIVEPMPLPVNGDFEVENKEYDGSTNAEIINPAALSLDTSGYKFGDEVYANFAATFSDPDVGENKRVSLSASTLGGSDAGNYVIDFSMAPTATAAITPKELTIDGSFTAQGKGYDGTTNAAIASNNLNLVGRVGSDDVTLVPVLAFDTPEVATGKTVSLTAGSSLTGAKAGNYTLSFTGAPTYTSGVITDKQATLGGSFTVNNKEYSGDKAATIATNNLTLVGVHSGDDVSIESVTAEFDSAVVGDGKTVRITGVTLTGANAGNYAVSLVGAPSSTANLTAKPLTITGSFTAQDRQYDGTVNAVIDTNNLTLGGIISGDMVSLNASAAFDDADVDTGKIVTLAASTLTGADAANYTLDFTESPTTTANITKATGLQAPAAPTLQSKTSTSVTLTPNAEQEFSKDNGTAWQMSNVFTGLTPSTEYSFITRVKDDANHEASPASAALTVTTDASSSPGSGPSGGSGGGSSSSGSTSSTDRLEIPSSIISDPNSNKTLTLENDFASVTISSNMLDNIPGIAGKKAEISTVQGDKNSLPDNVKAAIGDRPLISLSLFIDGKQTDWSNPNAPVTVSIPYSPTAEELKNPESIVIWYIDGSGNAVSVPNGRYNPATGTVSFFTTHFSDYAVAYVHKTFSDLGNVEWARKAIEVMASKGITNGTGDGTTFSPSVNITRCDFMVLLIKTLGLTAEFTENFDDVKPDAYYYNAVGVAKKLGIAAGSGNNLFKPTESISRQDMMVLAARALEKYQGLETADTNTVLERFSDRKDIAEYAASSLTTLIEAGLIEGSGNKLNPRSYTTRAEVAVFLYKIYNKYPEAPVIAASTLSRLAGQSRIARFQRTESVTP